MNKYLPILVVLLSGCSLGKVVVPPLPPQPATNSSMYVNEPAKPAPATSMPAPARNGWPTTTTATTPETIDRIVVSIPEQVLLAYHGSTILRRVTVSTAIGPTLSTSEDMEGPHSHVGSFTVFNKDNDHISGEYGSPMPYAMFFWRGHAIHATEPRLYDLLGTPASHGCVRTNLDDAKWLFERTPQDTPVIVEGPLTSSVSTNTKPATKKPTQTKTKKRADISRAN